MGDENEPWQGGFSIPLPDLWVDSKSQTATSKHIERYTRRSIPALFAEYVNHLQRGHGLHESEYADFFRNALSLDIRFRRGYNRNAKSRLP